MSLHDFRVSGELATSGVPFTALLLAAMQRANTTNLERLKQAFPEVHAELEKRFNSPGGLLPSERDWAEFEVPR